jgi:hypothetical protein
MAFASWSWNNASITSKNLTCVTSLALIALLLAQLNLTISVTDLVEISTSCTYVVVQIVVTNIESQLSCWTVLASIGSSIVLLEA